MRAETGGHCANEEREPKHDGKSDQILVIGDAKRQIRRHTEKIKSGHAENRREDGGPLVGFCGDDNNSHQIDHD